MIDLTPTDAQRDLTEGVRAFLAGQTDTDEPLPFTPELWRALGEMGVFGLPVAEEDGGLGLGAVESALVFIELGRAVVSGPLVWTQLAALAVPAVAAEPVPVAGVERSAELVVEHLDVSEQLLVLDADRVALVDTAAVTPRAATSNLDPLTPVAVVDALPAGTVIGDAAVAQRLRRFGTLLSSALLLGLADRALDVATAYAKTREQFDRPIGSFQAVKHLLADCFVRSGLARSTVYAAAVLLDQDGPELAGELAAAKLLAGEAADRNARTAIQVLGGMGFTWETLPHYLLKRAWVLESSFGTRDDQALAISALLADGVGA